MTLLAALLLVVSLGSVVARAARQRPAVTGSSGHKMRFVVAVARGGEAEVPRESPDVAVVMGSAADWIQAARAEAAALQPIRSTPEDVAIGILQPGDAIDADALAAVSRCFADPQVGAVQLRMRLRQPSRGLFGRLQEMELSAYSDLVLSSDRTVGAPGYGPSGFFIRKSALESLPATPERGAEDVWLGVQLARAGKEFRFCAGRGVERSAVSSVLRLVSTRAWALAALLRTSARHAYRTPGSMAAVRTLAEPFLLVSVAVALPLVAALAWARSVEIHQPGWTGWLTWYLLLFGSSWFIGYVGWLRRGRGTLVGSIVVGHLFALYSLYWIPATWLALARVVLRRREPVGVSTPSSEEVEVSA